MTSLRWIADKSQLVTNSYQMPLVITILCRAVSMRHVCTLSSASLVRSHMVSNATSVTRSKFRRSMSLATSCAVLGIVSSRAKALRSRSKIVMRKECPNEYLSSKSQNHSNQVNYSSIERVGQRTASTTSGSW